MGKLPNFITDFGQEMPATHEDGSVAFILDRYGVWAYDVHRGKYQVLVTGANLDELQEQYGPCEVVPLNASKQTKY